MRGFADVLEVHLAIYYDETWKNHWNARESACLIQKGFEKESSERMSIGTDMPILSS